MPYDKFVYLSSVCLLIFIIGHSLAAEADVSNIVIEGNRFQLQKVASCTYKTIAAQWANCTKCRNKIDCAVECALQTGSNKCQGFAAWVKSNGQLSSCLILTSITCKAGKTKPGEVVSYYQKAALPAVTSVDTEAVRLPSRKAGTLIDAFDSNLCGNGSKRFLYDSYRPIAAGKIVQGADAAPAEFPYQVMLLYYYNTNGRQSVGMCGGSLIDREWILTAAHCFPSEIMNSPSKRLEIHLGRLLHYSQDNYKTITVNSFDKTTIFRHPKFSEGQLHDDFALVRLKPALTSYTATIQPICLKTGAAYSLLDKVIMTTGWGGMDNNYNYPDKLQKLPRRVMADAECSSYHGSLYQSSVMLCTSNSGDRDQCGGDSGGPWAVVEQPFGSKAGSKWTLIGLTSWGTGDCGPNPGVGAKITEAVINWIKQTTANVTPKSAEFTEPTTTAPAPATTVQSEQIECANDEDCATEYYDYYYY